MALNIAREECDQVSVPVADGTRSGDLILVGDLPAVALTDKGAQTAGDATVKFNGSVYVDVTITTAVGDTIYAHGAGSGQTFNKTSSGGTRIGVALGATDSSGGRLEVKLAK
jgi:predicted RecA/RadA family phage recombinase